jgi:phage terminase small subunit
MESKKSNRGGYRPGAGRKPKPLEFVNVSAPAYDRPEPKTSASELAIDIAEHDDPKAFLLALMNDNDADIKTRADAAKALMPFVHAKLGEGGKKEAKQTSAEKAAAGKFAPSVAPKLVANGGRSL